MLIEVSKLNEGSGKFAHTYEQNELDLEDERVHLGKSATIQGSIRRSGGQVVVAGSLDGEVEVECDRCLKTIRVPVNSLFSLEYVPANDYQTAEVAELGEAEMAVSVFDGETIDIDEIVREQILLSVPSRALCGENCKGICTNCGANLNEVQCDCKVADIDPRWSALKDFQSSK